MGERLKQAGLATGESLAAVEEEVAALIDDAVRFAEDSPSPEPEDTLNDVFWSGTGPEELAHASGSKGG
jgi:pyruvate dehydrogenase E1 component alpha subunit